MEIMERKTTPYRYINLEVRGSNLSTIEELIMRTFDELGPIEDDMTSLPVAFLRRFYRDSPYDEYSSATLAVQEWLTEDKLEEILRKIDPEFATVKLIRKAEKYKHLDKTVYFKK